MAEQNISVSDLIKQLEESREVVDILIPSMGERRMQFYALTTLQQKNLIRTLVEDHVTNKKFYEELNKIIIQNITEACEAFRPDQINIYDRDAIALQLRIASLGDEFSFESYENSEKKSVKLSENIKIVPRKFDTLSFEENNLKVTIGMPSIIDDEIYNTFLDFNNDMDMDAITKYALEAVYIKIAEHIVSIDKIDTNSIFDCRKDPAATIQLVTNLPSKVFSKIYQKVQEEYIEPYNRLLSIGDKDRIDIKELFSIEFN